MKSMRELIKIMEGTESDMQTAGTVGRNADYAAFDSGQQPATESAMDLSNMQVDDVVAAFRAGKISHEDLMAYLTSGPESIPTDPEYTDQSMRAGEMRMEEGWEAPRPGALHARAVEKMKGLIFNQGVRDGEIAAETGNAANGFKANDALDIWYQYAGEYGLEPDGGAATDELELAYEQGFSKGYEGLSEDLNNGYDTEQYATGSDFFPNGADSPVVTSVGPSGARQGDNPEQKKMQVAEVHKELVYGYRKFLSESKNK